MLPIDLKGRRAFVAGVADDGGFGFAIAKSLAEAGAAVPVGAEHLSEPPRAWKDERLASAAVRRAALVREDLSARRRLRSIRGHSRVRPREQAIQGRRRLLDRWDRPAARRGFRREAARYRG